jgi:hypothetical protein
MPIFNDADLDKLSRPHVARAWFLEMDLPAGVSRLHNGTGRVVLDGFEWRGVTDPIGSQLVDIDAVEEPRFGQASAVKVTLSGANRAFFASVHANARDIEGRDALLYWAAFDAETQEVIIGPKLLFPGKLSSPTLRWAGLGLRTVSVTIESIWSSQNYSFGGRWTDADQRRRYPGDKGLQYVGISVAEQWE